MARQKSGQVYWLGFSDEVCKITKQAHWAIRHLQILSVAQECDFRNAIVHLVGKWWLIDEAIEIRYYLETEKLIQNITFIKHLTPMTQQERLDVSNESYQRKLREQLTAIALSDLSESPQTVDENVLPPTAFLPD